MKKLLVLILALVLLCPSAIAADVDPVVGYWYMYVDGKQYPEYMANIGNYDSVADLYYFSESGTVSLLENAIVSASATPTFKNCGKWKKNMFSYKYSIFGFGDGSFSLDGDLMKLQFSTPPITLLLRRLVPFNPYKDFVY